MEYIDINSEEGAKKRRKKRRRPKKKKKPLYMYGKSHKRRKAPKKRKKIHRQKKRNKERLKKQRIRNILLISGGVLLSIAILLFGTISIVRAVGKANLRDKGETNVMRIADNSEPISEEEREVWQEGWVRYQGKIYSYNKDIMTFLIMGIDKNTEATEVAEGTNGGQADALFLAVMNPHAKTIEVIGINRNTMTDIDIYDEEGAYVTTAKAQIAVQHGFGNGVEESCEYQKKAVSNLFYGLPIHGYAAINMSAIATINDAVGGVDVNVLEDLTAVDASLKKGETVHLMGESAFWYVKYRDVNVYGSADMRLERQKQYLNTFIQEAKRAVKEDISTVMDLYQAVMPKMVSDVTVDEVAYLAPFIAEYSFDQDKLHMLKGETVQGEEFEEFYVDETALYELILETFYEEVEIDG